MDAIAVHLSVSMNNTRGWFESENQVSPIVHNNMQPVLALGGFRLGKLSLDVWLSQPAPGVCF